MFASSKDTMWSHYKEQVGHGGDYSKVVNYVRSLLGGITSKDIKFESPVCYSRQNHHWHVVLVCTGGRMSSSSYAVTGI